MAVDLAKTRAFVRQIRRTVRLGRREFNICFVTDREMERLNGEFRGRRRPTDVLSFRWQEGNSWPKGRKAGGAASNFLGEVVISAETARRNARAEGHSTQNEIRWLIAHGLLHLLGYDHDTDSGEMTRLEYSIRERLGMAREARRTSPRQPKKRIRT